MTESAWTVERGIDGTKFVIWTHRSRWKVIHCGHPTALWPYYLEHPNLAGIVVSFNGRGFKTAAIAKSIVEQIATKQINVTRRHCVRGVSRVLVTAFGERVRESHDTKRTL